MKYENKEIEKLIKLHDGSESQTGIAVNVTQQCVNRWRKQGAVSKEYALEYQSMHPGKISAAKLMGV
tara:strand:+ start:299 stop:499 length:201 start_codon:yes stop_codon:yes gene_type:complete